MTVPSHPVSSRVQAARERKTSLDAPAINVMRPKKNKKGKKAIQTTQASPQPPVQETDV
jgi:hypothetical protein